MRPSPQHSQALDLDEVLGRLSAAAAKFNVGKVKQDDVAKMGGATADAED